MPDKTLAFYIRLSMEDGRDLKGSADKRKAILLQPKKIVGELL